MIWKQPTAVVSASVRQYTIRPGSVLDAPRHALLSPRRFDDLLGEHYDKQIDETILLRTLLPIYLLYLTEGSVDIVSTIHRSLRRRHERAIINLLKNNIEHLEQIRPYFDRTP